MNVKKLVCGLVISSLFGFAACGDNNTDNNANNANNSNNANNANNSNNSNNSKDKSSFEVESKQDGKEDEKVEGSVSNDKASKANSGASITGSVLTLFLVAPNGTTIQAVVETSEALKAPGTFTVSTPPDGTFVTWLEPINSQIFESKGGEIVLTSCPKAVGEQVTGQFKNVVLASALGEGDRTISGNFDMVVFAKAGDLNCKPDVNNNNSENNKNNVNNNPDMCTDYEVCDETEGSCCPYAQCMTTCQLKCFQTDPACNNPLSPDPVKCGQCMDGCLDSCNVSDTCRTDAVALNTCEDTAGCDAFGDEDTYNTCVKSSCCKEAKAAF